jgi:hypothetical protein
LTVKRTDPAIILSLARGKSARAAAKAAGWSERTLRRRLRDPDFQRQVIEARAEIFARASAEIAGAAAGSVRVLKRLLRSENERVALSAAQTLLRAGAEFCRTDDLESRVAALEASNHERRRA